MSPRDRFHTVWLASTCHKSLIRILINYNTNSLIDWSLYYAHNKKTSKIISFPSLEIEYRNAVLKFGQSSISTRKFFFYFLSLNDLLGQRNYCNLRKIVLTLTLYTPFWRVLWPEKIGQNLEGVWPYVRPFALQPFRLAPSFQVSWSRLMLLNFKLCRRVLKVQWREISTVVLSAKFGGRCWHTFDQNAKFQILSHI